MIELTAQNWETEVSQSRLPVLVDFWGPGCGPCEALSPLLADVAAQFRGKLKVGKVNAGAHSKLAMSYGVRALPTLIMFRGKNVVGQRVGGMSQRDLISFVNQTVR